MGKFIGMTVAGLTACVVLAGDARVMARTDFHDLTVEVTDVRGKEGELVIALFEKEAGFPDQTTKAARVARVSPETPRHTFQNLPEGKYVVVVFHDRDKNGKIEKSLLGLPKEPVGLSNHPKLGTEQRPDFDKARIAVTRSGSVKINLIEMSR